ncbi:hypothetical protein LTR02_006687 [Friedmanniomyces endolithicus]|nr:hypothetical protein LTR02_006687 [Friedmanniomyces endolithicus]
MAESSSMQAWATREATFQRPHQLSKRRASTTSKKKGANTNTNTVEWPHKLPTVEQLARVGFFFDPGPDTPTTSNASSAPSSSTAGKPPMIH